MINPKKQPPPPPTRSFFLGVYKRDFIVNGMFYVHGSIIFNYETLLLGSEVF